MKKLISALLVVCMCMTACLLCSCAILPVSAGSDEGRVLSDAKANYRSASLVVSGECVQTHLDAQNRNCCDICIGDVMAGSANEGDTIHCTNVSLSVGDSYLLYLAKNGDVAYAEDSVSYSLVGGDPMKLSGENVEMDGMQVSFSAVRREMIKLNSVISAPANCYYYSELEKLAEAADEIFIGRVDAIGDMQDTDLRGQSGGAVVEYTIPASVARITSFGSIKGRFKYGDSVKLLYAPAMSSELLDASTLTAVSYGEANAPALSSGGIYVFFLIKGPDDKQDYFFGINPMQGHVPVSEGLVRAPYVNKALLGYKSMDKMVEHIQNVLNG